LKFFDSFTIADFKKDKDQTLEDATKWCMENTDPDMACKFYFMLNDEI
jgi:hypothetical protein